MHSERFLTDRGVSCFKKSKAELVLLVTPIIRKKAAEDDKENMQCHCRSIGLDVREKSTKDLYGLDVRWRNKLVDVGPTSPLSSRYFCVDYLLEQGKWICERLTDDADVDADANTGNLNVGGRELYPLAAPRDFV